MGYGGILLFDIICGNCRGVLWRFHRLLWDLVRYHGDLMGIERGLMGICDGNEL